ncbi:3-hydroxyisobutyryl-CoA hydrolase, mitochondrial, partial [Eufriesea mexicana]
IKNGTLKLNCGGSNSISTLRYLSAQVSNTGPIVEPTLPQSQPQPQPQPDSKPPVEIPVPNKNALTGKEIQTNTENDVLFKDIGNKGVITLNRPKALNALNLSMVEKIYPVLKRWELSKELVIIEGAGEKAFCAGGDVKSIVNALRETENKVLEKTLFAMPETAIGLFPDVGGTYFLPRLKGKLGLYLGLTGDRLKGIDVLLAGIATHFVSSEKLSELKQDLLMTEQTDVKEVLNKYQYKKLNSEFCLAPYMNKIETCFSASLKEDNSEWAKKTLQMLLKASPTSLKVTMSAIQNGSTLNLADCLKMEYRLACAALNKTSDFCEGVRALLIDKDQKPKWNPNSLEKVTDTYIQQQFTKLFDEKELQF